MMNDKQLQDTPSIDEAREDKLLKAMTCFHQDVMDEICKLRMMMKETFEKFPFVLSQYDYSPYHDASDSSLHESGSCQQENEEHVPSLQETFDNITGIISACHSSSIVSPLRKPAALNQDLLGKFTSPPASNHSFTFVEQSHSPDDNITESESFKCRNSTSRQDIFTQDDCESPQLKNSVKNMDIFTATCSLKKETIDHSLVFSARADGCEQLCESTESSETQGLFLTKRPVCNAALTFTKNEQFRNQDKLTSGMNIPTQTQTDYKCHVCGKLFTRRANLNHHIKIHTGDKPFKCTFCNKCFTWRSSMTYHLRTHTRDKPCKCGVCGKILSSWSNFRAHIKTHTEEKPYACQLCKTSFTRLYSFKRHMRHYHPHLPVD